jgi:uncharacterized Zn finger protein
MKATRAKEKKQKELSFIINGNTENSPVRNNFADICKICETISKDILKEEKKIEFDSFSKEQQELFLLGVRHAISSTVYVFDKVFISDGKLNIHNIELLEKARKTRKAKKNK